MTNNIFILSTILVSSISVLIIYLIYFLKNKSLGLLVGLFLGLISMITFLLLINETSFSNDDLLNNTKEIFELPGTIFINLVLIIVPVYLVFIISSLVFNEDFKNIKKRTYGVSFISLLSLSIFGILIALLLIPLIELIPRDIWNNVIGDESLFLGGGESPSLNWKMFLVFGIIILTFITTIILKITLPKHVSKMKQFITSVLKYITMYFKIILILVPFVLFTRLSTIGMTNELVEASSKVSIMLIYIGLYMLGALILLGVLFTISIVTSDKNISIKEKTKIIGSYLLTAFSNQSAAVTLPTTQSTLRELGVCEEITLLTPTKGLFMGMVMCNGFTPMLMSLMILTGAGILTFVNVLIVALIIFSLSISTSGAGSSDYWITATTMQVMGHYGVTEHIFDALYLNLILVAHEVNEMTVAKPLNGLGHISATLVTEKYHKSVSGCDCEEEKEKDQ